MSSKQDLASDLPEEIIAGLPAIPPSAKVGFVKAVGYLFGGVANYFAAWSRRSTQSVDDKTDAKSLVIQEIAKAAARAASEDPDIVNSAIQSWLPKELRRQDNKAKVVLEAAITLNEESYQEIATTDQVDGEISDEWLNAFERLCEDASTESMQKLWGRVLAREVSKPGSFSKKTIRFLHELDSDIARSFEKICEHVLSNNIFIFDDDFHNSVLNSLIELESSGLISSAEGTLRWAPSIDENNRFSLIGRKFGILGFLESKASFGVPTIPLTKQGIQVLSIVPANDEKTKFIELANFLKSRKPDLINKAIVRGIALCEVINVSESRYNMRKIEVIWGEDPFDKSLHPK